MSKRTCVVCGNELPKKNRKYCSNTCNGIALRNKRRPDMEGKTPWNAGLTADTDERLAKVAQSMHKNVVDRDTLYQLYTEQNLSLRAIGKKYEVAKNVIKRLVDEFGLIRKRDKLTKELVETLYASGKSYVDIGKMYNCSPVYISQNFGQDIEARNYQNDAGIDMDKETIYDLYWNQWMSYDQIAEKLNVDFTAVPYWLKKFGIKTRTAMETRRGPNWVEPDEKQIIHLYQAENMGMQAIGNLFDVSRQYIKNVLERNKIGIRTSGYPNISHYTSQDGHKVKSSLELQVDDWLFEQGIEHEYEPYIAKTKYKADFKVQDTFIEVWGIEGNEKYERKRQKKLRVYEKHNLSLISIFPDDFPDLHILQPLTKYSLQHLTNRL